MKFSIVFILIFVSSLIFTGSALGQSSNTHIDAKLPTVFIEFVRFEKSKDKDKQVWLRLNNNSKWTIKLDASAGSTKNSVALYYETLDSEGSVKERHLCHACSTIELGSAKDVVFSIPFNEIVSANSLRIRFEYEWEDRVAVAPAEEPTHFVVFYADKIHDVTGCWIGDGGGAIIFNETKLSHLTKDSRVSYKYEVVQSGDSEVILRVDDVPNLEFIRPVVQIRFEGRDATLGADRILLRGFESMSGLEKNEFVTAEYFYQDSCTGLMEP